MPFISSSGDPPAPPYSEGERSGFHLSILPLPTLIIIINQQQTIQCVSRGNGFAYCVVRLLGTSSTNSRSRDKVLHYSSCCVPNSRRCTLRTSKEHGCKRHREDGPPSSRRSAQITRVIVHPCLERQCECDRTAQTGEPGNMLETDLVPTATAAKTSSQHTYDSYLGVRMNTCRSAPHQTNILTQALCRPQTP